MQFALTYVVLVITRYLLSYSFAQTLRKEREREKHTQSNEETEQRGVAVIVAARNSAGEDSREDHRVHVRHSPLHLQLQFPSLSPLPHIRCVSFRAGAHTISVCIFFLFFLRKNFLVTQITNSIILFFCPYSQERGRLIRIPLLPPPTPEICRRKMPPPMTGGCRPTCPGVRLCRRRFDGRVLRPLRRRGAARRRLWWRG